jgi:hypothetical protein
LSLQASHGFLWASTVKLLNLYFHPDPDPAFHSSADPDPDPASTTLVLRGWGGVGWGGGGCYEPFSVFASAEEILFLLRGE